MYNRLTTMLVTYFALAFALTGCNTASKNEAGSKFDLPSRLLSWTRRHCRVQDCFPRMPSPYIAALIGVLTIVAWDSGFATHTTGPALAKESSTGHVSRPLKPNYVISPDGSVTLRVCFNWSCTRRQVMTFSSADIAEVKGQLALCTGSGIENRLQRLRIGIWQMELLAAKYQPLLTNDRGLNNVDADIEGRTDCVDTSSNNMTFLRILQDLGELPDWLVAAPAVRDIFNFERVHWTAVVINRESDRPWTIDSWYQDHGHLPFVMPLDDWRKRKLGWKPPFDQLNPMPHYSYELCRTPQRPGVDAMESSVTN